MPYSEQCTNASFAVMHAKVACRVSCWLHLQFVHSFGFSCSGSTRTRLITRESVVQNVNGPRTTRPRKLLLEALLATNKRSIQVGTFPPPSAFRTLLGRPFVACVDIGGISCLAALANRFAREGCPKMFIVMMLSIVSVLPWQALGWHCDKQGTLTFFSY